MRKEIADFMETYISDFDKNRELDEGIVAVLPEYALWEEKYRERSVKIRQIFKSNEENIGRLKDILAAPLDDGTAADLYEVVGKLYDGCYDDMYVMKLICDPLIAYYTEKNDISRLVYLYAVMSFENFEFYGRIAGDNKDISAPIECYNKVLSFADHYKDIPDRNVRTKIIIAYSNLIAPIGQFDENVRRNTFRYHDEAYELYENCVKPLGDMTHKQFIMLIDLGTLALESHLDELSVEELDKFEKLVDRLDKDEEFDDSEGNLYRAKQSLAIFKKEKSVVEVIEEYIKYIKELPKPDFEGQDESTAFNSSINFFNSAWVIFELFENFKVPKEEQFKYADRFVDIVTAVLTRVPYSFMTTTYNEVCSQWFTKAEQYLGDFDKKRQLLSDMILCRQPSTYIHSRMVKQLAVAVARALLDKDEGYFDDVMMTSREKLLSFIGECAIMHDLGKCAMADVINKQARRLCDYEFAIIKLHPEKALEIINNDPDFLEYMDVMKGHHRSYDGKAGYPPEFDNRGSDIAKIIDLVTICDAMDAATDIYGRNYTAGKNFDTLYGELVEGKGVKYNPEIVELIGENKELYNELKDLTENRRGGIYYSAYQDILKIKAEEEIDIGGER